MGEHKVDQISRRTIAAVSVLGAAVIPLSAANANCRHPPIHWKFEKTVSTLWSTDEEAVCISRNLYPENISKIEIASKPRHGTAGAAGTDSVAYKPNWGYRGSDAFTYIVISSANTKKGAGRIARVNVFVEVR
jgi:hypothetical protein